VRPPISLANQTPNLIQLIQFGPQTSDEVSPVDSSGNIAESLRYWRRPKSAITLVDKTILKHHYNRPIKYDVIGHTHKRYTIVEIAVPYDNNILVSRSRKIKLNNQGIFFFMAPMRSVYLLIFWDLDTGILSSYGTAISMIVYLLHVCLSY
jgi:hypothetical protein